MTDDRWTRVGDLFDRALAAPVTDRDAIIETSLESDDVKREVRSLLAAHNSASGFLDHAASENVTAAPAFGPNTMIGPYRVLRVIGRGGMGVVYQAEDTRLHRAVALKALPSDVAGDEQRRNRLRQEARAAAALQHPGIATVYALEEIDNQLFISSEYLSGETLREELSRGPLPPARVIAAAIELARALCVAHDRGIVHRDLKPENIVRTTDGALKVLDFGLAQFDQRAADLVSKSRLTMPGLVAGTPSYMAPEQLLARPTDFRVDHFAFGVLLYEMAAGSHPFVARSLPSTIARILADTPDPPPSSDTIPPPLWNVIQRCLQKDPAHRFASTRDLLHALEATPVTTTTSSAAAVSSQSAPAPLYWWRFHQFAAAVAYWSMVWPVWHVHRALGRWGLLFFFATLAAVVVAGNLRLHLWFSSRVYPEDLREQRADVARWIRWADVAFAALLIIGGIALPDTHAGWAALLISFGIGAAVAFVFIEPATTRAAFRTWYRP